MRIARRLLIALAIPIVLFLVANYAVERVAEDRIAAAVQSKFDLRETPSVDLRGFPVVVSVLRGDLPDLTFEADDVTIEGLTLEHVSARFSGIEADGGVLGGKLDVIVGSGVVDANATEEELNRFVRRKQKRRVQIELREGLVVVRARGRVRGEDHDFEARGTVKLDGRVLIFVPRSVTVDGERPPRGFVSEAKRRTAVSVEIPDLPGAIKPTRLETHSGSLAVSAALKGYRLELRK